MKITVFTPTYNRAYIIENLYHSLQRQTFADFEWLVIDDGSTDETKSLFDRLTAGNDLFPIRYYRQENKGKCQAINLALDLARGELFFTVDSDDYLTDDALQKISDWKSELPANEKFCGFAGNLGTTKNLTPNSLFDSGYYDGTLLDRYSTITGERAIVLYTLVHRQYKYPVFPDEKFMTEAVAWNRMANDGYKMRFYNDIICIYEYRDDGLTKAGNSLFLNNPKGYGLWLREKAKFENRSPIYKAKMCHTFTCDLANLYTIHQISTFIGVPKFFVFLCITFHNCKNKVRNLVGKRK